MCAHLEIKAAILKKKVQSAVFVQLMLSLMFWASFFCPAQQLVKHFGSECADAMNSELSFTGSAESFTTMMARSFIRED